MDPEEVARIVVRDNEPISTFLVDGRVSGTWKVRRELGDAVLDLRPVRRLRKAELTELSDEGMALLTFLAPDATKRDVNVLR